MPNRILRDGINSSERVNALSPLAELFYRRLMSVVDDYGRYFAVPSTVRGACWPTHPDRVTEAQVSEWISDCEGVGLLAVYTVGTTRFLQLSDFRQPLRAKSKFPEYDIILRASCAQNDFTSRARTHTHYALRTTNQKGESEGVRQDNGFVRSLDGGPDDLANKLYRAHPKKKNRALAEQQVRQLYERGEVDFDELIFTHSLWCRSETWRKLNAQYCPPLDQWLDDKGYDNYPDEFENEWRNYLKTKGNGNGNQASKTAG